MFYKIKLLIIAILYLISISNVVLTEKDKLEQETKESYPDKNDEIESVESSKIFVPTTEWKTIEKDQKVPAGLHYRINLQTGLKEAKLLDNEEDTLLVKEENSLVHVGDEIENSSDEDNSANINEENLPYIEEGRAKLMRENVLEALKNIKSEDKKSPKELSLENDERKKLFRSYADLKEEFKELNMNVETDSEIISRLIEEFKITFDENLKINILDDLDYLTHQIDNAVQFIDLGGIQNVIRPGLNSSNEEIRKGVMRLLGSASQSNPKVQIAAFEEGLLNQLLRIVAREKDATISSKAVYALSCLVRGFPFGQKRLIEAGGIDTLREVFQKQDWQSLTLQLKVVSLMQDLLEEHIHAEGERADQLRKINLKESLVQGDWCPAISSLLKIASFDETGKRLDMVAALGKGVPLRPDHDTMEKIINAMLLLASSCKQQFYHSLTLLQSLQETYSDLAYKEKFQGDDSLDLFSNMALQIERLLNTIRQKDEL